MSETNLRLFNGVHALIYAEDAEKARAFFKDALGFSSVDAGQGWLLFTPPPAELGIHPAGDDGVRHQLYLMCDDVKATVAELKKKRVKCASIKDAGWGLLTSMSIPSGGTIGLYQPKHPTALRNSK